MPDREKVLAGLEFTKAMITFNPSTGEDIEPRNLNEADKTTYDACVGAIELLKEQEAIEPIPIKPILDEQTGRLWLCGKCGSYVGFEDNDPHDPNQFDKYCHECGRPVLWEGR